MSRIGDTSVGPSGSGERSKPLVRVEVQSVRIAGPRVAATAQDEKAVVSTDETRANTAPSNEEKAKSQWSGGSEAKLNLELKTEAVQDNTPQLKQAAENGDLDAQHKLGLKYAKGDKVPLNRIEAYMWLHRAVVGGHSQAMIDRWEVGSSMSQTDIEAAKRRAANWSRH